MTTTPTQFSISAQQRHLSPLGASSLNLLSPLEASPRNSRFGRIINIGTLTKSRSFKDKVQRNRPTTYEFRLKSSKKVNFSVRNDRKLGFNNLNLLRENNIFVDLFRSGGGVRFLYSVPPEGKTRKTTLSLNSGRYRLRLVHGGTTSAKFLNYRLEIKPR
jgi:hypothetical protein